MKKLHFLSAFVLLSRTLFADESINVKRYPMELQETYKLVESQCTTCHGLKDTTHSPEVLPTYWEKTVTDMREKKDSGITPESANQITEFLIYDSYKRRSSKFKKDMAALPEDQQAIEKSKLDQVLKKYSE